MCFFEVVAHFVTKGILFVLSVPSFVVRVLKIAEENKNVEKNARNCLNVERIYRYFDTTGSNQVWQQFFRRK